MPGADAGLLQIGGLIVNGLGQVDARLGGLHVRGGALAPQVLGDHQHHAVFPGGGLGGARPASISDWLAR